jgi:hypothetical protein
MEKSIVDEVLEVKLKKDKSIFGPSETERETFGVTLSFDEWRNIMSKKGVFFDPYILDLEMAEYIAKFFTGFVTEPATLIDGQAMLARSYVIDDIDKFSVLDEWPPMSDRNKEYYLYHVACRPQMAQFYMVSENHAPVRLTKPIMGPPTTWALRFVVRG